MPEMNGYETTAVIRNQDSSVRNHDIPIIALSANAMQLDREKCIVAGMDDYLAKPLEFKELDAMLRKWLNKKTAIADTAIQNSCPVTADIQSVPEEKTTLRSL